MNSTEPKTAEDVIEAVKRYGITRWMLRECSICYYPLYYSFENGRVFYDTGCDCTRGGGGKQERSYADVAGAFNIQSNPAIFKRMWNEFITSSKGEASDPTLGADSVSNAPKSSLASE